jgi:iron complex outermembrane recepter protein
MPGANPLFGLNALGGAVSIETKTGFSHAGHDVSLSAGSFGRAEVEAASGGHGERFGYFVAGTAVSDDGWRQFSPSRIRQVFGDLEWHAASTTVNVTLNRAANRLTGNGPAPTQLLARDRTAIFTYPDENENAMTLVTTRVRHQAAARVSLEGVLYFRRASVGTFNADDSTYDRCNAAALSAFLCTDEGAGDPVENQFGQLVPAGASDPLDATNNSSQTGTDGLGGAFQLTVVKPLSDRPNHFVAGVTVDGGRSRYAADTETARPTSSRRRHA